MSLDNGLLLARMIYLKLLKPGSLEVLPIPLLHLPSYLSLGFLGLKYVKTCHANMHKVWYSMRVWDLLHILYEVDLQMDHGHLPRAWKCLAASSELLCIPRVSGQILKIFQCHPKFLGRKRNHHMVKRSRHMWAPITCLGIIYSSPALLNKVHQSTSALAVWRKGRWTWRQCMMTQAKRVSIAPVCMSHGTEKVKMTLGSAKTGHHPLVMVEATFTGSKEAFSPS